MQIHSPLKRWRSTPSNTSKQNVHRCHVNTPSLYLQPMLPSSKQLLVRLLTLRTRHLLPCRITLPHHYRCQHSITRYSTLYRRICSIRLMVLLSRELMYLRSGKSWSGHRWTHLMIFHLHPASLPLQVSWVSLQPIIPYNLLWPPCVFVTVR